jgi:nucleotide-binding universal stress UspA family protein
MFKRIMVPLDGSSNSEIIIPYVMALAGHTPCELVLVTVAHPRISQVDQLHHAYLDRLTELLQHQLSESGHRESAIKNQMLQGKPAEEIVKYAEETQADLVAISSQGFSGQRTPLLGNIATRILWNTKKPVLLVRIPAEDSEIKQGKLFSKILLPLDNSKAGEVALEPAVSLARIFNSELILFQAITPIEFIPGYEAIVPLTMPWSDDIKRGAVAYLESVKERLTSGDGLKVKTEVGWGSPAESILNFAEENGVELIALSAHGQSNVSRWVFGSVTEKIMHAGNEALLIVR